MSQLISSLQSKDSKTINGAVTHSTTSNSCVDLFFLAGASRNLSVEDIENVVIKSAEKNFITTAKIVFWAGDIREGAGERRFFKIALNNLKTHYDHKFNKLWSLVPEYNRWDSLFDLALEDEKIMVFIYNNLNISSGSLLAKWMPREGKANHQEFRKAFCKRFDLTPKMYRKLISTLSKNNIENTMSNGYFSDINYEHIPSVAMNKYRKSFLRKDKERFLQYLSDVNSGKKKINASAIFPYQLYQSYVNGNIEGINEQWNRLPNYMKGNREKILPVCDVSGSMEGLPMDISISLGVYISERNESIFKDAFITFSKEPQIQYLKGKATQRFKQLQNADWGMNTDLVATFRLVLKKAIDNNLDESEMPTKILIISDMEFDLATSGNKKTNFEKIQRGYNKFGYKMPEIIFWNVDGRPSNFPVKYDEQGTALISGASPSILKSILGGKEITPESTMMETIGIDRYNKVEQYILDSSWY